MKSPRPTAGLAPILALRNYRRLGDHDWPATNQHEQICTGIFSDRPEPLEEIIVRGR